MSVCVFKEGSKATKIATYSWNTTIPIGAKILHKAGKPLVEPQVSPPLHRNKVAEPLVGSLVTYNYGNIFLNIKYFWL